MMNTHKPKYTSLPQLIKISFALATLASLNPLAYAEDAKPKKPAIETEATKAEGEEAVDVSKLSQKYWAQGKETELGVVQNRKYTSAGKWELTVLGGNLSTSPFLTVHHYGLSVGHYFNQYLSLHAIAWKDAVSSSEAYTAFQQQAPTARVYPNNPKGFYGLQTNYNFLYGKASLFGDMIIYVDLFLLGGLGITDTDSGKNFTPFLGIGQKIHLNKWMALHLDYRVMRFSEKIVDRYSTPNVDKGTTTNTTDAVTLGISFFL